MLTIEANIPIPLGYDNDKNYVLELYQKMSYNYVKK
jgi:hypothetical protein